MKVAASELQSLLMDNMWVLWFDWTVQELAWTKHDVGNPKLSQAIIQSLPDTQHPLHCTEHQAVWRWQVTPTHVKELPQEVAGQEVPDWFQVDPEVYPPKALLDGQI